MDKEKQESRKTVREEFAQKFISLLESDQPLQWTKGWADTGIPHKPYNGTSGREYNGLNRLILMFESAEKGYTDPRFMTFKQAQEKGLQIKKGEKAVRVEYWAVFDTEQKKSISLSEMYRLLRENPDRKPEEFKLYSKAAYVFNAQQISGIEPLPAKELPNAYVEDHLAEEFFHTLTENMGVELRYGGNQAYYSPQLDYIQLPHKEAFYSNAEFWGTALHEAAHATGSEKRLNRNLQGYGENAGSYSLEELRAEVASCFITAELGIEMSDKVVENHLAYVQSWITAIKQDSSVLFTAIKDADAITNYMLEKGRLETLREELTIMAELPGILPLGTEYEIWQLKDDPMNRGIAFMPYDYAKEFRLTESRYDKKYTGSVEMDTNSLDKLFYKFNVSRPADYEGHSLSTSDVIITKGADGQRKAWYCDSFGFRPLKDFTPVRQETQERRRTA